MENNVYVVEVLYPYAINKQIAGIFSTEEKAKIVVYDLFESECAKQRINRNTPWPPTPFHHWITKYRLDP